MIQAGGLNLVFDAGRGAAIRLNQLGVSLGALDGVFITHFHFDRVNGVDDLWMSRYIPGNRTPEWRAEPRRSDRRREPGDAF